MPKLYGDRWKLLDASLGQGGQSEVFRAIDTTGVLAGEYALKRVKNPERHARFRAEVEAIKRLDHPNIIKLIDHSALNEGGTAAEKQFLVMPIAAGGDLSRPDRLKLYAGSIDATLQVAKQIAAALEAAHAANVIHRDVKPPNVLFTGAGHDAQITDFGICLIREMERETPSDEVVGPRAFMAPELEYGGKLDVSPAADVYSLGKVIFYMYSGGLIVPREQLHEPRYAAHLDGGERQRFLAALLRQMICLNGSRIQTMAEVRERLANIEDWEKNARLVPINAQAMSSIERMQNRALETARVQEENAAARATEKRSASDVKDTFVSWLRGELEIAAATINATGILKCTVQNYTHPRDEEFRVQHGRSRMYCALGGLEFQFTRPDDSRVHVLQIRIFEDRGFSVRITMGGGQQSPQVEPVRDMTFAVIPLYKSPMPNRPPQSPSAMGYLTKATSVGTHRGQVQLAQKRPGSPRVQSYTVAPVTQSFNDALSQHVTFKASEWPGNVEAVRGAINEALSAFFDYVEKGANSIGL